VCAPSRHLELQELLQKGMDALSQAEVASALQVYFNLGELKEVGTALEHTASAHCRLGMLDSGWGLIESGNSPSASWQGSSGRL
jgi:hypothetical protein